MVLGLENSLYAGLPIWLIMIVVVWSLIWKGIALWKSSKRDHITWFVVFLIIHTFGVLEILYIYLFSKIRLDERPRVHSKSSRKIAKKTKAK